MKLNVISDLHCEFWGGKQLVEHRDNMILAGDIAPFTAKDFGFRDAAMIHVAGNHEYYGTRLYNWRLMPFVKEIEGVRFICATLWSDIDPAEQLVISQQMNDFHVIKTRDSEPHSRRRKLNPDDARAMHYEEAKFIRDQLDIPFNGTTVVVTHFVPRFDLLHPRHGSKFNSGYASNQDHTGADFWIYGHTHDPMNEVRDGTHFVCNPYGYYKYEHWGREDPWLTIEV